MYVRECDSDRVLTVEEVAVLWRDDSLFREKWVDMCDNLVSVGGRDVCRRIVCVTLQFLYVFPFSPFLQKISPVFWECKPFSSHTWTSQPFECLFLSAPSLLSVSPDTSSFQAHFRNVESDIAHFSNLGKDATLVVPVPLNDSSDYAHFSLFHRNAPHTQKVGLWQSVGEVLVEVCTERNGKPVWLSTSGMCVCVCVYVLLIRLLQDWVCIGYISDSTQCQSITITAPIRSFRDAKITPTPTPTLTFIHPQTQFILLPQIMNMSLVQQNASTLSHNLT